MHEIRLDAKQCVCCGICVDVCEPRALALRPWRSRTIEGPRLTVLALSAPGTAERLPVEMGSFPYMRRAAHCNGCLACVSECPVDAIRLH